MYLLLIAAGFIVFLILFTKFNLFYSEKITHLLVERKHRDAESILASGCAPSEWKKHILVSIGGDSLAKLFVLKKLQRIVHYFERTRLVDDEKTRESIVSQLTGIHNHWADMSREEIFGGPDRGDG
jgi:hypothetical protein